MLQIHVGISSDNIACVNITLAFQYPHLLCYVVQKYLFIEIFSSCRLMNNHLHTYFHRVSIHIYVSSGSDMKYRCSLTSKLSTSTINILGRERCTGETSSDRAECVGREPMEYSWK